MQEIETTERVIDVRGSRRDTATPLSFSYSTISLPRTAFN